MPKNGTFNLHASLLPQYRGAAPIHWAIINGETKTGVTTFFIDEKIDTGEVIDFKTCDITETDTVGVLHDKLMHIGVDLVKETLDKIDEGNIKTKDQASIIKEDNLVLKEAYKIFKDECHVSFNRDTKTVYNHIRGLNPFPGAWASLESANDADFKKQLKLFNCSFELVKPNHKSGAIFVEEKQLKIACIDGYIIMDSIQIQGKKRMNAGDFSRGFNFEKGFELK